MRRCVQRQRPVTLIVSAAFLAAEVGASEAPLAIPRRRNRGRVLRVLAGVGVEAHGWSRGRGWGLGMGQG